MNYIVDDIGAVVTKMNVEGLHYIYGHRIEIAKRLLAKNKVKEKYPLVALRMDIPEETYGGMVHVKLNILIVDFTQKQYNAEERYINIFKPILYPIYEKFMDTLSFKFSWTTGPNEGQRWPVHTKIDRPYWGVQETEGNRKNIFNDPLDAIEIIDLELTQRIKTC